MTMHPAQFSHEKVSGFVRAEIQHPERSVLVEAAIRAVGRNRILVNKQSVTRRHDLTEHLRVTVFAPDDLALVKGGPSGRRDLLDDLLVATAPRFALVITDYERVVKQRNALLRSGIRSAEDRTTRAVLDGGALVATPLTSQTSGALTSAAGATHLISVPPDVTELAAGAKVELIPVSWAP